jgi:hypothetical protein
MSPQLRRVSVSLRRCGEHGAHFLADHPVQFRHGHPEPIDYGGRNYSYSHTKLGRGYDAAASPEVYVFVESATSG